MSRSKSHFTLILCSLLVSCGLWACGSDPAPPQTDTSAAAGDAAAADSADAGKADTGATAADTAAPKPDTVQAKDEAVAAATCGDLAACAMACPAGSGFAGCVSDCGKTGSDAAKASLKAIADCAVDLCKEATNTAVLQACTVAKCFDKMVACAGSGGGATCPQTLACTARCNLGDAACRDACLIWASVEGGKAWGTVAQCAAASCANPASPAAWAQCLAASCSAPLTGCLGGGLNCGLLEACRAKCPKTAPTSKKDPCVEVCDLMGSPTATSQDKAYVACQESCKSAAGGGSADCIPTQCKDVKVACYPDTGTMTCSAIYKEVRDKCQGIGGDPACIEAIVLKGTGGAQEAYWNYEGCITNHLNTKDAQTANCTFPYDQNTCISFLENKCGSGVVQGCFKQN